MSYDLSLESPRSACVTRNIEHQCVSFQLPPQQITTNVVTYTAQIHSCKSRGQKLKWVSLLKIKVSAGRYSF